MEYENKPLCLIAGVNLKNLIQEAGFDSQEKFADSFGVDPRTVRRWIHGGINSLNTIEQIANFFDKDIFAVLSN